MTDRRLIRAQREGTALCAASPPDGIPSAAGCVPVGGSPCAWTAAEGALHAGSPARRR
jgi:hypothetical protein